MQEGPCPGQIGPLQVRAGSLDASSEGGKKPRNAARIARSTVTPDLRAIDCDVHPGVPDIKALLPYLDDHWRDQVEDRGIPSLESISYPPNAPITARPDWRGPKGAAATSVAEVGRHVFERWGAGVAILNCLYVVQLVFNEDMAAGFARALNDWIVAEWLDRDPRLRASIVVPLQNIEHAVDEVDRRAQDPRFV